MSVIEISTQFGIFFLSQAYGYAHGQQREDEEITVNAALLFGARHLAHFGSPGGRNAWPLSPVLCAGLLLCFPYIPAMPATPHAIGFVHLLLATLATVSCYALASAGEFKGPARAFLTWLGWPRHNWRVSSGYAAGMAAGIWIFWHLFNQLGIGHWLADRRAPWNEIFTYAAFGWIIFINYLGARFDGLLDRLAKTDA